MIVFEHDVACNRCDEYCGCWKSDNADSLRQNLGKGCPVVNFYFFINASLVAADHEPLRMEFQQKRGARHEQG